MRSLRAPGIVAIRLTILIVPIGVFASNAWSVTATPMAFSCDVMYSRVRSMPGEPAGRGPMATT
jgi:hypothetical protein